MPCLYLSLLILDHSEVREWLTSNTYLDGKASRSLINFNPSRALKLGMNNQFGRFKFTLGDRGNVTTLLSTIPVRHLRGNTNKRVWMTCGLRSTRTSASLRQWGISGTPGPSNRPLPRTCVQLQRL